MYRNELLRLARERPNRVVGVLVDYYAMPHSWPGRDRAGQRPHVERGRFIEDALVENLRPELGDRFIPCVQLHEFESLLFVSPENTAGVLSVAAGTIPAQRLQQSLPQIVAKAGDAVEAINDSPTGAPSKRLTQLVPGYDKVAWGVPAASQAGLDELRAGCPWLDRWLRAFEAIAVT